MSHYTRADSPHSNFSAPDLSTAKLYHEFCTSEEKQPLSKQMYHKVFNEEYNLAFEKCETEYV